MEPITIVLLATLLPACLLVAIFAGLCLYLFLKLRSLRESTQKIENIIDHPEPVPQAIDDPQPLFDDTKRITFLSDDSNKDWEWDGIVALGGLDGSGTDARSAADWKYRGSGDESWAKEVLEDIKYKGGVPVPVIFSFFRKLDWYDDMIDHIMKHVVLDRLSLECDPADSLLPFTPEVHQFLQRLYKSLEEVKLSTEMAAYISKIPFLFAEEYAIQHASNGEGTTRPLLRYNKEVHKHLANRFAELFGPLVYTIFDERFAPDIRGEVRQMALRHSLDVRGLDDAVEFHLRMLTSPRRLKFKWPQETTTNGSKLDLHPALYAYADEDGVLLQEPKMVGVPTILEFEGGIDKVDIDDKSDDPDFVPKSKSTVDGPADDISPS